MLDDLPNEPGIYAIVNTRNGCRYVGQAKNIRARVRTHIRKLEAGRHRTNHECRLQQAWNLAGREAFRVEVLELVAAHPVQCSYHERPDNLSLAEHYYINERAEYNADKRIVRDEFRHLVDTRAWRQTNTGDDDATGTRYPA